MCTECRTFVPALSPYGNATLSPKGARRRFPEPCEYASGHCPFLGGVLRLYPRCLSFWCLKVRVQGDRRRPWLPEIDDRDKRGLHHAFSLLKGPPSPHSSLSLAKSRAAWRTCWLMAVRATEESRGSSIFPSNQLFFWAPFARGQGHLPLVSQARNLRLFTNQIQSVSLCSRPVIFSFEIELRFPPFPLPEFLQSGVVSYSSFYPAFMG